uniref:Uncharacterized protein n=1 Tax=Oryza rufipogon TaxID=4529 RepID=A0A0E0NBE4_ORYRU
MSYYYLVVDCFVSLALAICCLKATVNQELKSRTRVVRCGGGGKSRTHPHPTKKKSSMPKSRTHQIEQDTRRRTTNH